MSVVTGLKVNYLKDPIGIGLKPPRFSWYLQSDRIGAAQTAYQLHVAKEADFSTLVWDTGWVESDACVQIEYGGEDIQSMTRYFWRVRVKDEQGAVSGWSDPAFWETTIGKGDWKAEWVEPEGVVDPEAFKPAPYLRKEFKTEKTIAKARLYITSHGCYEAYLNGKRVGDQVFMPGNTSAIYRVQVQTYDVTDLVAEGENCIGVILGDGWYRGQINANSSRNSHGTKLALLSQLVIEFADGSRQIVSSDHTWKTKTGPIIKSDMKDGEIYDARLEMPGWNAAGFDETNWTNVYPADIPFSKLVPTEGSPIRKMEEFPVVKVIQAPNGETVLDFGQNLAGIVTMKVSGPAGTTVTLRHSETLDENGNFTLSYLGGEDATGGMISGVKQRTEYTLKGEGEEIYEPHFTVMGFRYVEIKGYPGEIDPAKFKAIAIYSDMGENGTFTSSNEKLNQLHQNVRWSQKGNFLDIPTDCPTRERAGWTGDAQIFVHAGSLLMDDEAFYTKWLKDVSAEQFENGLIRNFIPAPPPEKLKEQKFGWLFGLLEGSSGWGDAIIIIPWVLYQMYGDKQVLAERYDSMKAWMEYERNQARRIRWSKAINPLFWLSFRRWGYQKYIWDTKYQWGEWLEPDIPIRAVMGEIIKHLFFGDPIVSSAYFTHSARLMSKIAAVLGKTQEAAEYSALAEKAKDAYQKEFFNTDGTAKVYAEKQAPYVRAIAFDLVDETLKPKVKAKLVENLAATDNHLGTGFLSTPFLCEVLADMGRADLAYEVILKEDIPSWLYAIGKGATTVWEDWDGIDKDNVPSASLNHYSKGAVVSWFYEYICGIRMDEESPAYKHFFLQPLPGGGLTHAKATFTSMYGRIEAGWEQVDGKTKYTFTVPANSTATVVLQGTADFSASKGVSNFYQKDGCVQFDLNSGSYEFVV
ncbi:MAG: glycoside hydrolase family 78 protein [Anaerolineae bacterium]|jgi:alpha-L-rhamnosidase|nr:glycoside hydrolase family 78 protein [Anaerolineae bacterium]